MYNQSIPITSIRLRAPSAEVELRREGIEISAGSFLRDARRIVAGDVTKTKAFTEGRVVIQDEASQLVAALVGRGKRVLDCCAAPGGKTWAIADRNPDADIVAVELHRHRAEVLRKRVLAKNVRVTNADIRDLPIAEPFDRVLVDAPCSGTGTMARKCSRDASSGTTPPYLPCTENWLATMEDKTRVSSSITAAAVSSHELSIARILANLHSSE